LHTRIKVECARRRAKMTDVVRELLEQEFPKPQHLPRPTINAA